MAVAMLEENPVMTSELYDQVRQRLDLEVCHAVTAVFDDVRMRVNVERSGLGSRWPVC